MKAINIKDQRVRTGSMGLGMIAYFPNVKVTEEEENDDA